MRVLDLTGNAATQLPPGTEFVQEAGDASVDMIVTRGHLSRLEAGEAYEQIEAWAAMLAPDGELHLFEPSAEWAAREILGRRYDAHVFLHLFGMPDSPHRMCYTLEMLRDLLTYAGLLPRTAETRAYPVLTTADGQIKMGELHYIVGIKSGERMSKAWLP